MQHDYRARIQWGKKRQASELANGGIELSFLSMSGLGFLRPKDGDADIRCKVVIPRPSDKSSLSIKTTKQALDMV